MNEAVKVLGKVWHKSCFKCGSISALGCGRVLAVGEFVNHQQEPFCNSCYNKNFKMKGATTNLSEATAVSQKHISATKDKKISADEVIKNG
eukprot:gene36191-47063_t